jgi:hypothetical protein
MEAVVGRKQIADCENPTELPEISSADSAVAKKDAV